MEIRLLLPSKALSLIFVTEFGIIDFLHPTIETVFSYTCYRGSCINVSAMKLGWQKATADFVIINRSKIIVFYPIISWHSEKKSLTLQTDRKEKP